MYWNLIKLRKEKGLYQKDMADLIGGTYLTYGQKESGKAKFDIEEMKIIKEYFGKPMDYIFLDTNSIDIAIEEKEYSDNRK